MANTMGIKSYDYVEFYVGSAKMVAYWYVKAMGMNITGYMGPETGVRDRVSYYLTQNKLKFVITSILKPSTFLQVTVVPGISNRSTALLSFSSGINISKLIY